MNRLIRAVLSLTAVIALVLSMSVTASADTYTGTVNLARADRNLRGSGYEWNNPDNILTLDGLNIDTEDDFGIKFPPAARVVLKGTNRIKAGKYGIGCHGSVVFEGDGTLIVEAGDAAIYSYSTNSNHKLHFMGGEYELTGGSYGILSDIAEISVTGGKLSVNGGTASAKGRVFTATGGAYVANGGVEMSHLISINRGKAQISASDAALKSGNLLEIKNAALETGDSIDNLSEAEAYSGQRAIKTVPEKECKKSVIFGEKYPAILDYAVMAGAAVLVAAGIVGPILHKKRKTKKLYESLGRK